MKPRSFCLNFPYAPGDVTVLTALARDLKTCYPASTVWVQTGYPDLWLHNPHAHPAGPATALADVEHVAVNYLHGIHGDASQKFRAIHFLRAIYEDFNAKTGLAVPTILPRGDFHFGLEERPRVVKGRYWVIAPGWKTDMPTKGWDQARWQQVVDALTARGLKVVQTGGVGTYNGVTLVNPQLLNTVDLCGQTDRRTFLRLVRDADGVICGNSFPMHVAAALEKPCVVLAGGREAWWWAAYVNANQGFGPFASAHLAMPHRYLHTHGLLRCVDHDGGCWKRGLAPDGDTPCLKVVGGETGLAPACMQLITVDHVLEAVMSYYRDDALPPVSGVPKLIGETLATMKSPGLDLVRPRPPLVRTPDAPRVVSPPALRYPGHTCSPFDHPTIGGKFTVFTLLYGDYEEMHRKSLGSFLETADPDRVELRVLSNELCAASVAYIDTLVGSGQVHSHDRHRTNDRKYPVMRAAFHDREPIATPYLIWFDDDTVFDKDPYWLKKLATLIIERHPSGGRLYGPHYRYTMNATQAAWIREATWYRGLPFQDMSANPSPNGNIAHFASGGFWALETAIMVAQDVPDRRLGHNGGDWHIGLAVAQGGGKVVDFSARKDVVRWSAFQRRGLSEPHPGAA